jgi:voltage-gated potassium channel
LGIKVVERMFARYHRSPASIFNAMTVIITAIMVSVVLGGFLIRLVEPAKFPSLAAGMWWALQTVTTVGYGDAVPETTIGRMVATVVMLSAIAFVSVITAVITSSFVERARKERRRTAEPEPAQQLAIQLAEITARLDRIERAVTVNQR